LGLGLNSRMQTHADTHMQTHRHTHTHMNSYTCTNTQKHTCIYSHTCAARPSYPQWTKRTPTLLSLHSDTLPSIQCMQTGDPTPSPLSLHSNTHSNTATGKYVVRPRCCPCTATPTVTPQLIKFVVRLPFTVAPTVAPTVTCTATSCLPNNVRKQEHVGVAATTAHASPRAEVGDSRGVHVARIAAQIKQVSDSVCVCLCVCVCVCVCDGCTTVRVCSLSVYMKKCEKVAQAQARHGCCSEY
jgi:hypothetical protein